MGDWAYDACCGLGTGLFFPGPCDSGYFSARFAYGSFSSFNRLVAARGSDRLHAWLYGHPHFGKLLINWEQQGSVSRASKVIAVLMLIISWTVIFLRTDNLYVLAGAAVLFFAVAVYLISRPEPNNQEKVQ